jgi:hypothetical protein
MRAPARTSDERGSQHDEIIRFLLKQKSLIDSVKDQQDIDHVLVLPNDVLKGDWDFDAHREDYVFQEQGQGRLRRPWDNLTVSIFM